MLACLWPSALGPHVVEASPCWLYRSIAAAAILLAPSPADAAVWFFVRPTSVLELISAEVTGRTGRAVVRSCESCPPHGA